MSDPGFIHEFAPGTSPRTLLLLHGTGGNEHQLLGLGRELDPAAALLSPRGKILEHGAPRFFRRLAEGVFDEEDVVARAHELAQFVNAAMEQYQIDADRLVAVGYSNGANIAAALMFLGLAPFRKSIFLRPMVPLANVTPADLTNSSALLLAGRFDPIAQLPIVQQLTDLLRQAGAAVDLVVQQSGHELTAEDVETAQSWLAAL